MKGAKMRAIFVMFFCVFFVACASNGAKIGEKAPEIAARNLDGQKVFLEESADKLQILVFMQKGCTACLKELPLLDEFVGKNASKVVAFGIDSVDEKDEIAKLGQDLALKNMTLLKDDLDISWQRYDIFALPSVIIIKKGVIVQRFIGDKPWQSIEKELLNLL